MSDSNVTRCARAIREALDEELVNEIGRESGFCRKLRKFTPIRAAWTIISGLASGKIDTLADLLRLFTDLTDETMGYKPFHDRLSAPGFPEFFRQLLEHLMTTLIGPIYGIFGYAKAFSDILVQDGSSFGLNEGLKNAFPGRFTTKAPAAVEVHCTFSLFEGQPVAIGVAPDVESERDFLPEPEELKGKLLLMDAGYMNLRYIERVKEHGGDVITPAKGRANPKILASYSGIAKGSKIIGKKLKEVRLPRRDVDLLVECMREGRIKQQIRLVGVYVKKEKKHVLLYTTLDSDLYPALQVSTLYRLRWQIELFFKECKSHTDLKKFQTANPRIAEGLIWASMTAALFRRFLLHHAFAGTGKRSAPFIAASMSWMFFRDLGRSAVQSYRSLHFVLKRILLLLRNLAKRTNPQRLDSIVELGIGP